MRLSIEVSEEHVHDVPCALAGPSVEAMFSTIRGLTFSDSIDLVKRAVSALILCENEGPSCPEFDMSQGRRIEQYRLQLQR